MTLMPLLLQSTIAIWLEHMRDRPVLAGPGIDVSHHQGQVDWRVVFADLADDNENDDVPWVYIKATEGVGFTDTRFLENAHGALDAGFRAGPYHFCRISSGKDAKDDARREVDYFVGRIRSIPFTLVPCLDVELGGIKKRDPAYCMQWWETATEHLMAFTSVPPLQYTGYWTWRWVGQGLDGVPPFLTQCPLWLPDYSNGENPVRSIIGWPTLIWQHTQKGRVTGIRRKVDRNIVLGSREDFARVIVTPTIAGAA